MLAGDAQSLTGARGLGSAADRAAGAAGSTEAASAAARTS